MKSVAISMTIAALAASLASPARAGSLGDCYDLAVLECGLVWGDQDYGDDDYKKCINGQFDICDATHKSGGGSKLKLGTAKPPRSQGSGWRRADSASAASQPQAAASRAASTRNAKT